MATLAGEVRNPGKTFPRALLLAVLLVVLAYLLPVLAALGIYPNPEDWVLGYYAQVGAGLYCTQGRCGATSHRVGAGRYGAMALWHTGRVRGGGV